MPNLSIIVIGHIKVTRTTPGNRLISIDPAIVARTYIPRVGIDIQHWHGTFTQNTHCHSHRKKGINRQNNQLDTY